MKTRQATKNARRQIIAPHERRALVVQQKLALVAQQRLAAINRFHRTRRRGLDWIESARSAGTSIASISRWRKSFFKDGLKGLMPRTDRCGRKSDLHNLRVPRWVLCHVERLALQQQQLSIRAAWRKFGRTKDCPPKLAARIRIGVPPSFITATKLRTVRVRVGKHVSVREALAASQEEQNER